MALYFHQYWQNMLLFVKLRCIRDCQSHIISDCQMSVICLKLVFKLLLYHIT